MASSVEWTSREWEDLTDRDERIWRVGFNQLFDSFLDKLITRGNEVGYTELLPEIEKYLPREEIKAAYRQLYPDLGSKYYERVQKGLGGLKMRNSGLYVKDLDPNDPYFDYMQEFLDSISGTKIKTVIDNTGRDAKNVIKAAIEQGVEAGVQEDKLGPFISSRVKESFSVLSTFRAERIARTEVTALANRSSFLGAVNSGVEIRKRWSAFLDKRTRQTHIAVHGSTKKKYERFSVGFARLSYPGEYTGSAPEETINCRCRLSYDVLR